MEILINAKNLWVFIITPPPLPSKITNQPTTHQQQHGSFSPPKKKKLRFTIFYLIRLQHQLLIGKSDVFLVGRWFYSLYIVSIAKYSSKRIRSTFEWKRAIVWAAFTRYVCVSKVRRISHTHGTACRRVSNEIFTKIIFVL